MIIVGTHHDNSTLIATVENIDYRLTFLSNVGPYKETTITHFEEL